MRKPARLSLKAERRRQDALWKQHVADTERWRRTLRPHLLRLIADRTATLTWSRTLLRLLLDELHVEDSFTGLVGSPRHLPDSSYPQAIAVAIALRHSWQPHRLFHFARRLRIPLSAKDIPSPARNTNPTRDRTPGHHGRDSRARLRPVKALRSAPTPVGACGLDRRVGRAADPHLRDVPADRPRPPRSSRS